MSRLPMPRLESWFETIAGVVVAYARSVTAVAMLGAAGALYYTAGHLGINTDTGDLFSDDLDWRQVYLRYAGTFPIFSDNLILVIDGSTPETAEAAAAALAARLEREEPALLEWVYRPRAGPFFETSALLYLERDALADLVDNLAAIQPFLGKLAARPTLEELFAVTTLAIGSAERVGEAQLGTVLSGLAGSIDRALDGGVGPLSWREIMQGSRSTTEDRRQIVLIKPKLDYQKLLPTGEVLDRVRTLAREVGIDASRGLRIRITGELAMSHEELDSVSRGGVYAAISAVILVIAVLVIGLRSWKLVVASIVTLLAGLAYTAAFAALAVGHLNLISVAFAVLYIGLGIDFAVHLCLRYRDLVVAGQDTARALIQASSDIGSTLFVCALTTGVGFVSFVGTDFTGVSELGLISGAGMFLSLAASILFLPALLRLMPLRVPPATAVRRVGRSAGDLRAPILAVTALLALLSLGALPLVEFDRNPINVREAESEAVSTFLDLLAGSDTSPWPMVTVVEPGEVEALRRKVERLELVAGTLSIEDFVPTDQEAKLLAIDQLSLILALTARPATAVRDDPTRMATALEHLLTATRAALAADLSPTLRAALERLLPSAEHLRARLSTGADQPQLLERLHESLLSPLLQELRTLDRALSATTVGVTDLPDALKRRWITPDGRHRVEIYAAQNIQDSEALRRFVAAVRSVVPDATDSPVTLLESGNVVVRAFQQALLTALLLITVILALLLRSFKDVLLVLTPLILAGCFTTAAMVALDLSFNFANVITLPLLLGIGVDNGIHIVRSARSTGISNASLLRTSTARAVVVSSLTTIFSFGNLAFSAHPGTASMGQVLTMGLTFNLLCTLVVLPALLSGPGRAARAGR